MSSVYLHIDPITREVVYVGRGTLDRPWQVRNRSPLHCQWLIKQSDNLNQVVFVVYKGTKEKVKEKEIELIDYHRPKFNMNYDYPVVAMDKELFDRVVRLRELGSSYEAIAKAVGLSTMTIHRALNGKTKAYDKYK